MGQNRQRVDFIDAITHELKTSLTAIIVSAELLDEELHSEEGSVVGRLVQSIIRNARSMNEEISRLSQTSGVLVAGLQLQLEPVDIGAIIHSSASRLYPKVKVKRQSLSLELPDSLPLVKADRLYLEGIVQALLDNATKFTPEEGKLKVSARRADQNLVVEVSDTGIGIPAEEQERIFEPHYQIVPSKDEGSISGGIGLAVIKPLIELHGGKIWLKSKVGKGSTFTFSLPVAE